MSRTIAYWVTTAIVAGMLLLSLSYLTGNEQVVAGSAKAGYPQHLRIVLGIAKPLAAVVLLGLLIVSHVTRPSSRRMLVVQPT
jgi:hypothetical protein